jgi:hypothetical protein
MCVCMARHSTYVRARFLSTLQMEQEMHVVQIFTSCRCLRILLCLLRSCDLPHLTGGQTNRKFSVCQQHVEVTEHFLPGFFADTRSAGLSSPCRRLKRSLPFRFSQLQFCIHLHVQSISCLLHVLPIAFLV